MEFFETPTSVPVLAAEYHRLLGYPRGHELSGRARELAEGTRAWYAAHGKPWIYAPATPELALTPTTFRLGDIEFASRHVRDQLADAGAHTAMLVAVSAGRACEEQAREFWLAGKPDEYFFMEMFGSAVVEHLITQAGARICAWAEANGMAVLPHYSPGYSGWDVAEQGKLWETIRRGPLPVLAGELEVMETGMLRPKKSLLAMFGVTRELERARQFARLVPCESCAFSPCQYRRVPYRHALPQIEIVHRLQRLPEEAAAAPPPATGLNLNAKYSVNARALRKWTQERLGLSVAQDGRIAAQFRYEGTTCSSLGQPLAYDYQVQLELADGNYRIVEANCFPAPGDTGHAAQCAYLADQAELQRCIAAEKPLLGRPLDEVLAWQRSSNPAGCYCEESSRAHKWGLVLEVLHFALAQRLREQTNGQPASISEYSRPLV